MDEQQAKIEQALDFLAAHYPDSKVNSNKSVGGSAEQPEVIPGAIYVRTGMKQSRFHYLVYASCVFENVALTGSQFQSVTFQRTALKGNSFACCDFYDVEIDGSGCEPFEANNFSLSNFERCRFSSLQLVSSGMLGSLFHNCSFKNTVFQSSTLEGTSFINSQMIACDFSSVNVEFVRFSRTSLDGVCFPFYQFPYVIGAADYITVSESTVTLRAGEKTLSISEYANQLDNLILFFLDKKEYFPMCNLCIAKGATRDAKQHLLDGVSTALRHHDFRMVRHFCQLALHHDILDEFTRQRILQNMDEFLQSEIIPETQLNYYMTYIGSIRTLLQSGGSNSVALHFNIKTNVLRDDPDGVQYVNTLLNELNKTLSRTNAQNGFQVTVANYSPYEIVIQVLSAVGSAASIASLIWMTIDTLKERHTRQKYLPVDIDVYRGYVDAKIDSLRADLLRLQKEYSKRTYSKYIKEVTQQLKTDLEELYSKDIMIFKIKNDSPPKET